MLIVGQHHRGWNCHPQLRRQRVVEELVIRRPPERIVDDHGPMQHGILQISPIERDILRDAIDDHVVLLGLIHAHAANLHKLRRNIAPAHRIDLLDQRGRKRVLHPKHDPNFFHNIHSKSAIPELSAIGCQPWSPPAAESRWRRRVTTRSISPPSATRKANRAPYDLPRYPASSGLPCHSAFLTASHSDPDTYPTRPKPAQSSSADSGSNTSRRAYWADSPQDS